MNRFRRIVSLLFGTLILCCFPGAAALARSAVDVDHDAAMTVVFRNTATGGAEERVSNAEFRIYRIADIDRVSDYHWSGDFIDRKENFREMTQERWKELAETLWQEVRNMSIIRRCPVLSLCRICFRTTRTRSGSTAPRYIRN